MSVISGRTNGIIKDTSGFDSKDISPKTVKTTDVDTDTLNVEDTAVINTLTANSITASDVKINGRLETDSLSETVLQGFIKINNASYVETQEDFIAELAQAAITGGKSINVAPGVFIVDAQMTIPDNTDIRGSGINTTIFRARSGYSDASIFRIGSNSSITDFQIDGNGQTPRLLTINNDSNIQINFIKFYNTSGSMTVIENSSTFIDITNCQYEQKLTSGNDTVIICQGASNITMDKIVMTNLTNNVNKIGTRTSAGLAITITDQAITGSDTATSKITISNVQISNITFDDFGVGIDMYLKSTTLTDIVLNNIIITDINGPDSFGAIYASSDIVTNISKVRIANLTLNDAVSGAYLYLTDTENLTLTNANIEGTTTGTIFLNLTNCSISDIKSTTTTGTNILITGCTFMTFNGLVLSGGIGIVCQSVCSNFIINNVTINGNGTFGGASTSIYMQEISNAILSNISIDGNSGRDAIRVGSIIFDSIDIIFDNIDITNTTNGYDFFAVNAFTRDFESIKIIKNTFKCTGKFIYNSFSSTQNMQIRNLIVSQCLIQSTSLSNSQGQIELVTQTSSYDIKILQNTFINSSSTSSNSIQIINNSGNLNDIIISNNNFRITNATGTPIYLSECENSLVSGNTINSNSSTYAIEFVDQVGNSNISCNNVFDGAILFYSNISTAATRIYNIQGNFQETATNLITTAATASTNETFKLEGNNSIASITSGTPDLITLGSGTGMNFDIGKNHCILYWAPSSGTSSTYLGYHDRMYFNSTNAGGNFTITLSDLNLQSHGHIIYIELDTFATNTLAVNPTSPGNDMTSLATYATGVTFNASGEYAIFRWSGATWDIIANSGGVIT